MQADYKLGSAQPHGKQGWALPNNVYAPDIFLPMGCADGAMKSSFVAQRSSRINTSFLIIFATLCPP
jgi:hypothetical protein